MGINFRLSDNPSSRSAYNEMLSTNRAIEKTIGVLTSKMRIRTAADDAAGLAMSEKMRAEIAGLDKAMSNVQDGMSFLQTAEGGLSDVNAILQRMRELAVQSASDTLTQSDRAAIQSEFGEIRNEIDRIAETTQYNSKKLLDGSTSALWSSTDPNIRVILNGSTTTLDQFGNKISAEGNYDISISAKAGQSEVQKTKQFSLSQDYLLDSYYGLVGTGLYYDTDGNEITTEEAVKNFVPTSWATSGDVVSYSFKITNADDSSDEIAVKVTVNSNDFTPQSFVDYLNSEPSVTGDTTLHGTDYEAFYNSSIGKLGIRSTHNFTVNDSEGGYQKLFGAFQNGEVPSSSSTIIYVPAAQVTSSAPLLRSGGMRLLGATPDTLTSGVTTLENETKTSLTIAAGANVTLRLNGDNNIGKITLGANSSLTIEGTGKLTGLLDGNNAPTQSTDASGEATGITNISIQEGLYENGFIRASSIGLSSSSTGTDGFTTVNNEVLIDSGYVEEAVASGTMANGNFRLSQLANFYDSEGKFLLDIPQKLDIIQGDGQTASVTLYAEDTLNDVVNKLNSAISEDLGQSKYLADNSGNNFASLVTEDNAAESTSESVAGTIVIRSAIAGSAGKLKFSAAEELLNALGMNTIQEATESEFAISISDAHDTRNVAMNIKTTGNRLVGAISPNVDIAFDAMSGITAQWNDSTKKFVHSSGSSTTTVHLKENSMNLQAGATEGETINFGIGEISSESLNLKKVDLTSRETASEAITVIDAALDTVSAQEAKVGGMINRLEHSASVISVMQENVTGSESRIRDADMAKVMVDFTKLQIMLNAQNSVFSQANQQSQNVLTLIR